MHSGLWPERSSHVRSILKTDKREFWHSVTFFSLSLSKPLNFSCLNTQLEYGNYRPFISLPFCRHHYNVDIIIRLLQLTTAARCCVQFILHFIRWRCQLMTLSIRRWNSLQPFRPFIVNPFSHLFWGFIFFRLIIIGFVMGVVSVRLSLLFNTIFFSI